MPKSRTDIQERSDTKRGVKAKTYKLPIKTINLIEEYSDKNEITKARLIAEAIELYVETHSK